MGSCCLEDRDCIGIHTGSLQVPVFAADDALAVIVPALVLGVVEFVAGAGKGWCQAKFCTFAWMPAASCSRTSFLPPTSSAKPQLLRLLLVLLAEKHELLLLLLC